MKSKVIIAIQIVVIAFFAFMLIEARVNRNDPIPPRETIGKKKMVYKDSVYEVMWFIDTVYTAKKN